MGGQRVAPPMDVSSADHSRARNATVRAYERPKIKKPEEDAMISANRERIRKERENMSTALMFSGVTGGIVRKDLLIKDLKKEISVLKDGWQEYDDQCKLLLAQKRDIMKKIKEHDDWCNNFDQLIGPFEAQYDACKATVKESYDFAKGKYKDSLQKLIDDFGYHPAFKRWFDDF